MGSVPFAVGVRTEPDYSHPFGGLLTGDDYASAINYGINYGGNGGFSDDGPINRFSYASRAAILPISEQTGERYRKVVEAFRALHDKNRLPFYVTGPFRANAYFEPPGPSWLPDGTGVQLPDSYGYFEGEKPHMYDSHGRKVTDVILMKPPGLQRVRSNCATFFNLAAQLAGIDLRQLDQDWFSFRRGHQLDNSLKEIFGRHAGAADNAASCRSARIQLPSSKHYIAAETSCGSNIHFAQMVEQAFSAQGGLAGGRDHIGAMEPFDAEPLPWPAYLRRELDHIGHQIP